MKYLLLITVDPTAEAALSEEERTAICTEHDVLIALMRESGELIGYTALDDPSDSRTEFLAGYYLVDCETPGRAGELAALIPDARFSGIEVRPVMESGGLEM